jgi:hypothetical protein
MGPLYLTTLLATGCAVGGASACEGWMDQSNDPIAVNDDGSFKDGNFAGAFPFGDVPFLFDNSVDTVFGNPIRDRGNGKVAQRVFFSDYACSGREALLFVDCPAKEAILLAGVLPPADEPKIAGSTWTEIRWIQAPEGPVNITGDTTVKELQDAAQRHGIEFSLDVEALFGEVERRDRYDVFLGCKIYYPDTPGGSR